MTGKEIIKRVIAYDNPPRIGCAFNASGYPMDIRTCNIKVQQKDISWHEALDLVEQYDFLKNFDGMVRHDELGNLWGRMRNDTSGKGEVLRGALASWEDLEHCDFSQLSDESCVTHLKTVSQDYPDQYLIGILPGFPFSIMRNLRGFSNFLMDVLLEQGNVSRLSGIIEEHLEVIIANFARVGMDGVMVYEDWGIQDRLLINPSVWREMFLPAFERLSKKAHDCGMKMILHSCGYIYEVLEDMIQSGIDVFQFDQPALMGEKRVTALLRKYKRTLFSPVDIQKILPTGDRVLIENAARDMVDSFGCSGGLIACDYLDYPTIKVKEEWAGWARDIFMGKYE